MREERLKNAVQAIASHRPYYATTSLACEKALRQDTAEGYRDALRDIVKHGGSGEYAQVMDTARDALKDR
jgi:hypothetical protein